MKYTNYSLIHASNYSSILDLRSKLILKNFLRSWECMSCHLAHSSSKRALGWGWERVLLGAANRLSNESNKNINRANSEKL